MESVLALICIVFFVILTYGFIEGANLDRFHVQSCRTLYIPEDIDTGGSKNRAVHSTWFQGLTEVGYPGMVIFMGLLLATFFSLRRVVKRAVSENNSDKFLFAIGLEGAFFGYLTAITFLDRFRGLSLYLLILMVVAFYRIDKQDSERLTN